jgi:hypothetical protein
MLAGIDDAFEQGHAVSTFFLFKSRDTLAGEWVARLITGCNVRTGSGVAGTK